MGMCILTKKIHHANYVGVVKMNHGRYPMRFIANMTERWPSGSHLMMETEMDGVRLYALGIQIPQKKIMFFYSPKEQDTPNQEQHTRQNGQIQKETDAHDMYPDHKSVPSTLRTATALMFTTKYTRSFYAWKSAG